MRAICLVILAAALLVAAAPARAQTYDPSYPICLQAYGIEGGYIECRYNTMDQCRLSAWGRAAQCVLNPYRTRAPGKPSRDRRLPRMPD